MHLRLFLILVFLTGCKLTPPEPPPEEAADQPTPGDSQPPSQFEGPPEPEGLAFPGQPPPETDPAELPGPQGPFVEPALEERPRQIHRVVIDRVSDLKEAEALCRRAVKVAAVPVGYPSVEQAKGVLGSDGWVVLAGKFARKAYAVAQTEALRKVGFSKSAVVTGAYRHDRLSPATNALPGPRAGLVFAGISDMEVPLLKQPARDAQGTGKMVMDKTLVLVTAREEVQGRLWYRVKTADAGGFIRASRVLVDYNVFPSPGGGWAVMGVSLGCIEGDCRWDYWVVGKGLSPRKLLGPAAQRLPNAFSPDGKMLAYAAAGKSMTVAFQGKSGDRNLGPGTSPSWSPDGKILYFRRPGVSSARDEVMAAAPPDFQVRTVLDYRGQPYYPKALSLVPSPVDMRQGGARLYTMFYRLVKKDAGSELQRWKVLFNPDGKIVDKTGEQISE